jgi:hypothetical protein
MWCTESQAAQTQVAPDTLFDTLADRARPAMGIEVAPSLISADRPKAVEGDLESHADDTQSTHVEAFCVRWGTFAGSRRVYGA